MPVLLSARPVALITATQTLGSNGMRDTRLDLGRELVSWPAHWVLSGAHFTDGAVTENADLGCGFGRHGDVLVGMVVERPGRVVVGQRHGEGRIWA